MPESIAARLAELPNLSRAALYDLWKQLFNASPPAKLRRDLMIPILGYRIQEQAFGSLRPESHRRLREAARAFEADSKSSIRSRADIKPGTRLIRQWRSQVHVVQVEANGYEYKGVRHKSLSEIARLITGTRWSGPLFFGLKDKPARNSTRAK